MTIPEAKKYIQELRKRQDNPYLWPDYLTGLPDKAAIIRTLDAVYPKIGQYAVVYLRIANIHPYLIKYGPDKHAEIIQWAAAILKTACDQCPGCFVGTVSTHDFMIMCRTKNIAKHMKSALATFNRKMHSYYVKEDLKSRTTLSFSRNGDLVRVGLMRMVAVVADSRPRVDKSLLIREMGRACDQVESGDKDVVFFSEIKDILAS
ncbi:MAG: hypothetical protein M0024_08525 [Nitrospiraceae bacterium]|nr:hypothetical protein [Nitrospiraceae bacterium]